MGSQQLLLIIIGIIVVGIAIAVGLTMFNDSSVTQNRAAVASDLQRLAGQAHAYWKTPASMGGGDHKFTGATMAKLTSAPTNDNGTYSLVGAPDSLTCVINGKGVEKADGTSNVEMEITVNAYTKDEMEQVH